MKKQELIIELLENGMEAILDMHEKNYKKEIEFRKNKDFESANICAKVNEYYEKMWDVLHCGKKKVESEKYDLLEPKVKKLTKNEIEKRLGYKIEIVEEN